MQRTILTMAAACVLLAVPGTAQQEINDTTGALRSNGVDPSPGSPFIVPLTGGVFDISGGSGALEPMQLAVRSLVERATVEMVANLYGMPGPQSCLNVDPLGSPNRTVGLAGAYVPAYNNLGTNNAQTREDPNRWNVNRDSAVRPVLRGRY